MTSEPENFLMCISIWVSPETIKGILAGIAFSGVQKGHSTYWNYQARKQVKACEEIFVY